MKRFLSVVRSHLLFLIYVLGADVFFAFLMWLVDSRSFQKISLLMLLFSVLSFLLLCEILSIREGRIERALSEYILDPDETRTDLLLSQLRGFERSRVDTLCRIISEKENARAVLFTKNEDYEEYVEAWAHEAKTPIALLTLILDNQRDSLSPELLYKIEYIRARLSGSVEQMLQYSRIKGGRKDYLLENLPLREILEDVVEEYRPLLSEKNFTVVNEVEKETIYADKRALTYMLGQIVSNAIKYSSEEPRLTFRMDGERRLSIEDNGIGVKKSDLPFIFERGFTGNTGQARKKATGMGLYLVEKIAEDMHFQLNVASEIGKGFQIVVQYPNVGAENMGSEDGLRAEK